MNRLTIAVDFDGVLHAYTSGWNGPRCIPDPAVPGAMAFLARAVESFDVAVFSSRARYWGGRRAMRAWLLDQLYEYFWRHVNDGGAAFIHADVDEVARTAAEVVVAQLRFPLLKPPAHLFIDDRAIQFRGVFPSIATIREFRPWKGQGALS